MSSHPSDQRLATVVHERMTLPPILTDGEITPKVIRDFESHCSTYFLNAKGGVTEEQKVTRIMGCFQNDLVDDWTQVEKTRLLALTFEEFMKEFRERWLPPNWEQAVRTQMLNTRLSPSQRFQPWAAQILSHNVSLRNTQSHMTDAQLRTQLEAALDEELRALAAEEGCDDISGLREWMLKVTDIDNRRQRERKRLAEFFDLSMRAAKRQNIGPQASGSRNSTTTSYWNSFNREGSSSSSSTNTYPPKLTENKRKLLHEHEGCLKCRMFYVPHCANKCTITLSGKDYKERTLQDALRAKNTKGSARPPPIASITELPSETPSAPDLVAALFPPSTSIGSDFDTADTPDTSLSSVSAVPPLEEKHLTWDCTLTNNSDHLWIKVRALIDSGAHLVLIRPDIVTRLHLPILPLPHAEKVSVAIGNEQATQTITNYVLIQPTAPIGGFSSTPLHAVITPGLCMPLILGLPFLTQNKIVCNYAKRECLVTTITPPYNLLNNALPKKIDIDVITAVFERAQTLTIDEELLAREKELRTKFSSVFEPPPHFDELRREPLARIRLKDPNKEIKSRNYPCPRKWKEAWHTLLQQHLDAGRIRPSSASAGSGAFIIPKADPSVLPRWVNDYRQLNANTITDSFPIPLINDILADLATGRYFATIDMTNSFFQTRMHPNDIPLTAVNTPWGLYEWAVMPMGIKNAPAIQQRRVTEALRPWIGRLCHVYIDNIGIWSRTLKEHTANVSTILQALADHKLYCNPKKTKLFSTEIRFLGHRVSGRGIEVDEGKADRVKNWPWPINAKQVRGFLG